MKASRSEFPHGVSYGIDDKSNKLIELPSTVAKY
jgi:hypothetical protein